MFQVSGLGLVRLAYANYFGFASVRLLCNALARRAVITFNIREAHSQLTIHQTRITSITFINFSTPRQLVNLLTR
jgi:hypothetical protein